MMTIENEGTAFIPKVSYFSGVVWHHVNLERYPVPSVSLVDEDAVLSLFIKGLGSGFLGPGYTAGQEPFTHTSPSPLGVYSNQGCS